MPHVMQVRCMHKTLIFRGINCISTCARDERARTKAKREQIHLSLQVFQHVDNITVISRALRTESPSYRKFLRNAYLDVGESNIYVQKQITEQNILCRPTMQTTAAGENRIF